MANKKEKKTTTSQKENNISTSKNVEEVVFVRVLKNFNDATDSDRFISSGPNTFYRTNKERADMLAKAGYVEYDQEEIENSVTSDSTDNSDSVDNGNVPDATTLTSNEENPNE